MHEPFDGNMMASLVREVEKAEGVNSTPMTDAEFAESMDNLIAKGLIRVGFDKNGELGFVPTEFGRAVVREMERQEAH